MRIKSSRRLAGTFVAAAAALATLAACSSSGATTGSSTTASAAPAKAISGVKICAPKKKVGLVSIADASPTIHTMDQMIMSATKTLGWSLHFVDGQSNVTTMEQAVQSFVNEKDNLIIVGFSDAAPLRQGLQAAKAAGIPVIQIGGGIQPSNLYTASYAEDETKMGQLLGSYIAKTVPNARIADLATSLNYTGVAREKGFRAGVASAHNGAKIVDDQQVDMSNATVNTSKTLTDMLTAHPDINAVMAVFDPMAVPAAAALRAKGSKAKLFSYYTSPSNLALVGRHQLAGVVDVNVSKTAAVALDQFIGHLKTNAAISPDALTASGGLTYRVVSSVITPASNTEILKPYLTQWEKAYPCS